MKLIHYDELRPTKGIKYSREHTMRKVKAGEFPEPIELSNKRVAWIETEIDAWIEAFVAKRDAAKQASPDPAAPQAAAPEVMGGQRRPRTPAPAPAGQLPAGGN